MEPIIDYLIKLSVSLAVMYLFYYFILRPLTFYQWNRIYLLVYAAISILLPFVNVTPWITKRGIHDNVLFSSIPLINEYPLINSSLAMDSGSSFFQSLSWINICMILFCVGAFVMTIRLIVRWLSLNNIKKQAVLMNSDKDVQLYNVDANISPFSFGNSIFVNRNMHTEAELQRIIQHEFVHVKQQHTLDLMVAELLCILNWFNPFAWLLRSAMRQNLEFIADNQVVANGIDKKEYQYLLLKVVGTPNYTIANHLNFSHLKKRIAMMNKMKSAKLHLTKFLFVLPLMAVILLSFRQREASVPVEAAFNEPSVNHVSDKLHEPSIAHEGDNLKLSPYQAPTLIVSEIADTVPVKKAKTLPITTKVDSIERPKVALNDKGYHLSSALIQGEKIVVVKKKKGKIVKLLPVEEWNEDKSNELTYGKFHELKSILGAVAGAHEPLYVIDGVIQTESPLENIDTASIESITVLKDAAAKDVYGEKGANGVILIVLKKQK